MMKKRMVLVFMIVMSSRAACLLDFKSYNSISWKKESFPFEIAENHLNVMGEKYVLQDHGSLLRKGTICYSVDERYAKITQPIQCEGCLPTLGFSLFELKSDTLKKCEYVGTVDLDEIKKVIQPKNKGIHK